jgi:hypothetical protein
MTGLVVVDRGIVNGVVELGTEDPTRGTDVMEISRPCDRQRRPLDVGVGESDHE